MKPIAEMSESTILHELNRIKWQFHNADLRAMCGNIESSETLKARIKLRDELNAELARRQEKPCASHSESP